MLGGGGALLAWCPRVVKNGKEGGGEGKEGKPLLTTLPLLLYIFKVFLCNDVGIGLGRETDFILLMCMKVMSSNLFLCKNTIKLRFPSRLTAEPPP